MRACLFVCLFVCVCMSMGGMGGGGGGGFASCLCTWGGIKSLLLDVGILSSLLFHIFRRGLTGQSV